MSEGSKKKKVLFLCTGNSARSQMAEGYLKAMGGDRFEVFSAGIAPVGVNPRAVAVMKEVAIDISAQTSDLLNKDLLDQADLLITLCGDARENCPFVPVKVEKRHWPLDDPARAEGTDAEIIDSFRQIRDQIKGYIEEMIAE